MQNLARGSILNTVLIVFGIILVISYFKFDLKGIVESEQTQRNLSYVTDTITGFWHKYLERPATYLWKDIFIKLIWEPAVENLENIRDHRPTTIENQGPALPNPPTVK